MLALSLALQAAGHNAALAGPPENREWAARLGCPYHPMGMDVLSYINRMANVHSMLFLPRFIHFVRSEIKSQFDSLPAIIRGADRVVGSSLAFALPTLAEAMNIPCRYIAFTPGLLPSGRHPFPVVPFVDMPAGINQLTWKMGAFLDFFNTAALINRFRKQSGLKPIHDTVRHILGEDPIVATDPVLGRIPPDVDIQGCVQTGYMHLHQPSVIDQDLVRFMEGGPDRSRPVYAGFGSMAEKDQARIFPMVVKAVRAAGCRMVTTELNQIPPEFVNAKDIFFIKQYPHMDLFPHTAAVIHHGGAGTTGTAAACGVPQVIIPHLLDQFYWGNQVYLHGLGPAPIRRSRLTLNRLARAVEVCISDRRIRKNAVEASKKIKNRNGLEMTVRELLKE